MQLNKYSQSNYHLHTPKPLDKTKLGRGELEERERKEYITTIFCQLNNFKNPLRSSLAAKYQLKMISFMAFFHGLFMEAASAGQGLPNAHSLLFRTTRQTAEDIHCSRVILKAQCSTGYIKNHINAINKCGADVSIINTIKLSCHKNERSPLQSLIAILKMSAGFSANKLCLDRLTLTCMSCLF